MTTNRERVAAAEALLEQATISVADWKTKIASGYYARRGVDPMVSTKVGQAYVLLAQVDDCAVSPPPPPPPPPPTSLGKMLGLSTHISARGQVEVDRVVGAKAGVIRDEVPWSWTERTKGAYDWSVADKLCALVKPTGLPTILQVGYAPPWSNGGKGDKVGPLNVADFAQWYVTVTNYLYSKLGTQLYGVELWNEPNIGFLTNPANGLEGDPVYYAALLKAVWARRGEIPVGVKVIGGACSGSGVTGVRAGALVYPWLETVLSITAGPAFHDFSCHPYSFWDNATAEQMLGIRKDTGWGEVFYGSRRSASDFTGPSLLQVLGGGFTGRIHCTEFGAPTDTAAGPRPQGVSETEQARLIDQAVAQWKAKLPNPGYFCVYTASDENTFDLSNREFGFGIWRSDGTAKPAVAVMRLSQSLIDALARRVRTGTFRPEVVPSSGAADFYAYDEPIMHRSLA